MTCITLFLTNLQTGAIVVTCPQPPCPFIHWVANACPPERAAALNFLWWQSKFPVLTRAKMASLFTQKGAYRKLFTVLFLAFLQLKAFSYLGIQLLCSFSRYVTEIPQN